MPAPEKLNTAILGAAGEHHVMCRLSLMNLIAALASKGVPPAGSTNTGKNGIS